MNNNPIAIANYCNLNDQIERWSKVFYFVVVKLTMSGIILPIVFVTAINLFLYKLGDDSYFLPFPIVYVLISIQNGKTVFIHFNFVDCRSIGKHRKDTWWL